MDWSNLGVFIVLYVLFFMIFITLSLYLLGNYTFWLPYKSKKLPRLIMLHQVDPDLPASGMNMPPAKFEQLLQYLVKEKSTFCFVSELEEFKEKKNVVAITFDDGFIDNYQHAYPLLKKYGIKSTIYLATQIEGIEKLNDVQIKEMSSSGLVEFGAHTQHHINLLQTPDEEAYEEILKSKRDVEALVGHCSSFAYPFGRYNEKHQQMVKEIGFKTAVSTRKKIECYSEGNQFELPRISASGMMNAIQMRIALAKGRYKL